MKKQVSDMLNVLPKEMEEIRSSQTQMFEKESKIELKVSGLVFRLKHRMTLLMTMIKRC